MPQVSEHRFLPVMPAPGQVWVGSYSRRGMQLTGQAADTVHGPAWNCELLDHVWDDARGEFSLRRTGKTMVITEWQLSHCDHRPDAVVIG